MPQQLSIHDILLQYFGFTQFRPQQAEIIQAVMNGQDVLALLPTGGGKSLCYQVPALAKEGLCLVISPLIALMKDQVLHLRKKNIGAAAVVSGMAFFDVKNTFQNAANGTYKFLYLSPERLQSKWFQEWLPALPISLIAVDEAHCISQWGYDFRPPYLKIAALKDWLPTVPIIALTASATQEVQQDICDKLLFKNHQIFRQSFARPNLSFSCFRLLNKYPKLIEILQNVPGCALVYCKNRRHTKEVAAMLEAEGITASYYHAGLSNEIRSQLQHEWINNTTRVMVCTNAFGMGIDKPDVRTVVHIDVPDCLENYYQEAGRAGRDGKKSYAVLLYTDDELRGLENQPDLKFPVITDIRRVYEAVCNYLQIAEGIGENNYYDFDITEFCERWKLGATLVANVLKTLEQAGYIAFNETVFITAKIGFCCSKEYLFAFEKSHPLFQPILKHLLRLYEGIFDNHVGVSEPYISKTMRQPIAEIIQQIKTLAALGIINYQPKKDTPQVYFLYSRVAKEAVIIDQKLYLKRKTQYEQRIRTMIRYAVNTRQCRSEVLQKYFGEKTTMPCGVCDVCLLKKSKAISEKEMLAMAQKLKTILHTPMQLTEIWLQLKTVRRATIEKAIEHLLAEQTVAYDMQGYLFLKM